MSSHIRPPDMEQYILSHFDEAVANGYIKAYVQPVVRTITGQVCGLEALARWEDPEYGVLMPGDFIAVLEKHRRIHELDICILRDVCRTYKLMKELVGVPVSINLSRLDYELCDAFEEVESVVRAYKVPRSILCIEVTESAIAENESLMRRNIERFRAAGYAVWMDDFGSGYSSLNVLKDFVFDELKFDMRFMSDFSTRSKSILASMINMAKRINIQTLTEGVETEEQFQFLRNVGCEKVQGFLFGRPMPFEECLTHVSSSGMSWESPHMRRFYDDIGRVNVLSPVPFQSKAGQIIKITGRELNSIPLAILELSGHEARLLYSNLSFENTAAAVDWPICWLNAGELISIPVNRISQRIQTLLQEARSKGESRMLSVYNDEYYEMRALRLAFQGNTYAVLLSMTNLSKMSAMEDRQQIDEAMRSLYSLYEQVSLINLNDNTVIAIHQDRDTASRIQTGSLLTRIDEYSESMLFPDDRERFRSFMEPDTLESRVIHAGGISTYLRTRTVNGVFAWKSYNLVRIRENMFYLLIRDAEGEVMELQSAYRLPDQSEGELTPELLWANIVNYSDIKFFWKDRERRFAGASKSFLDHYDFKSQMDILGKTDEDMGWHIHPGPFRDEEWKVLNEGITSQRVEGDCLVQGENHEIVATKRPLFSRDGKIVGLIGSFYQTDSHDSARQALRQARTDDLTGLLNSRGLYEDLYAYIDEYKLRGQDFARIEVAIDDFEDFNGRYGFEFGDAVIRETGRALLRCCGNTATVGRVYGCNFTVLRQFEDAAEIDGLIERIRRIPSELRLINGIPFSMFLSVGTALYSETENRENMAMQAELRRLTDDIEGISQNQLIENSSRIFHMVDDLPISYAVYKVLTAPEGSDAIILYANRKFLQTTGLSPEALIGKRVNRFFTSLPIEWLGYAVEAGINGKTVETVFHFTPLDMDLAVTAQPIIGPGFCAFTFRKITK